MVSTKRVKQVKPFVFILLILPSFLWIYMFFVGTLGEIAQREDDGIHCLIITGKLQNLEREALEKLH